MNTPTTPPTESPRELAARLRAEWNESAARWLFTHGTAVGEPMPKRATTLKEWLEKE
jgi:hypothetical protein